MEDALFIKYAVRQRHLEVWSDGEIRKRRFVTALPIRVASSAASSPTRWAHRSRFFFRRSAKVPKVASRATFFRYSR